MKLNASTALFLLTTAPFLGGCAAQSGAQDPALRGTLRGIAASVVAAHAFDGALAGGRRGDDAQIERAGRELRRIAGTNPQLLKGIIGGWATQANLLAKQAEDADGDDGNALAETSNAQYRAALDGAPDNAASLLDAQTLNSLGYFLADKGSTREDFERAAVLTRAAYKKWDISGKAPGATAFARATGPQDSYAWSLFRLGRWQEARAQQTQVWKMVDGAGLTALNGDIAFHLGEIYRALGEDKKARAAYEAARNSQISDATRVLVEGGMKSLDLARV